LTRDVEAAPHDALRLRTKRVKDQPNLKTTRRQTNASTATTGANPKRFPSRRAGGSPTLFRIPKTRSKAFSNAENTLKERFLTNNRTKARKNFAIENYVVGYKQAELASSSLFSTSLDAFLQSKDLRTRRIVEFFPYFDNIR